MVLLFAFLGLIVVANATLGAVLGLRYVQDRRSIGLAEAAAERVRPVAVALAAGRVSVERALDAVVHTDLPALDRQLLDRAVTGTPDVFRDYFRRSGAVARAVDGLRAARAWDRAAAARGLGLMGAPEATGHLVAMTADRNFEVRCAASIALGQLGVPEAIPAELQTGVIPSPIASHALMPSGSHAPLRLV